MPGLRLFREEEFSTRDVALNVARGPASGPPLVLLHGVTRRWQDFAPLLAELATRWEVVAIDFRGHGKSGRAKEYRTVDYVRDAVALVRELAPQPAVVYGHSLGAMVAAATAAELPDHVRGLVLEDPPWDTLGVRLRETCFYSMFSGLARVAQQGGSVDAMAQNLGQVEVCEPNATAGTKLVDVRDAASLRFGAACLKQMDPAVLEPLVAGQWLAGYDRAAVLRGIRCPALLLQADWAAGGMLPDADALSAAELMPGALRVKLDGVGHLMHWLAREKVLAIVLGFLESLE